MQKPTQPQNVSEKLLWLAVHASPSGILIVDKDGLIVFVNQALSDMFGYGPDELLGHPVEILIPKKDAEVHRHYRAAFNARYIGVQVKVACAINT
ncbi:MAG: hypothetical protein BMS9Abin36_2111 [Gammaproteobacteria bacterium]|nr:MAG: hypothetical protein BMS9Abin36_2111 [Gammaproteobacteria bacterium]